MAVAPGGGLVAAADSGAITGSRTRSPTVAVGPDGAFAALAPDRDVFVTVAGMPTGAGAPPPLPAVLTGGISDVETLRWTNARTLEVTVSKPTQLQLRDSGMNGPVVAAATVSVTDTATLRGSGPVTLIV